MKKFIIYIMLIATGVSSCKKAVDGINVDPSSPLDAPAITMLTGVQVGNMNFQEGESARIAGMWNGYFIGLQQQMQSWHQYVMTARNFDDIWQRVYSGTYKNIVILKKKALAVNNIRLVGVAQVIEANLMGSATDLWGDIPYSQAASNEIMNPVFDSQASVYQRIQLLLDSAIVNLNSTAFESFAAQDIHFAGNMLRWIQTANTLKARYYMHTKDYTRALSSALLGISVAANNFVAPHFTTGKGAFNLYYQFVVQDRPGWMDANGSYAVSLINPTGSRYRGNTKTIERSRYNFLFSTGNILNTTTNGFFGQAAAFPLATFAENLLILAEADARVNGFAAGLIRLNAYRAYMATGGYIGSSYLTAGNFRYDPYVAADFAAGGIENPVATALPQDRALLREILEERYVTFIGTIEGFNDMRRVFKETDIRIPITTNIGSQLPQRFLYPQVEIDRNTSTPNPIPSLFAPTPVNL